jgi:hypothetical protein
VIHEHANRIIHQQKSDDAEHGSQHLMRQPVAKHEKIDTAGCPEDAEEQTVEQGIAIPSDKDRQTPGEVVDTHFLGDGIHILLAESLL